MFKCVAHLCFYSDVISKSYKVKADKCKLMKSVFFLAKNTIPLLLTEACFLC